MPRLFPFVGPTFIYKPKKNYQTVLAITCATAECAVYDSLPVKKQCIVLEIISLYIIFAAIQSISKWYLKTLFFSMFLKLGTNLIPQTDNSMFRKALWTKQLSERRISNLSVWKVSFVPNFKSQDYGGLKIVYFLRYRCADFQIENQK